MLRFLPLLLAPLLLVSGCASRVDNFTTRRVLARGLPVDDVGKVCGVGESLTHPLASLSSARHPPRKALVIAEAAAALCLEPDAWEAELDGARIRHHSALSGEGKAAELTDALERERRAHHAAAKRFHRSWLQANEAFGPVGGECPRIREDDEIVYLLGLFAGLQAVLHDQASGGRLGVSLGILNDVARASECLDDERWWHVPAAFQAGIWATIPGSGPEGYDAWGALEEAALAGEASGVRLARGVTVLLSANGGQDELVRAGIRSHARSMVENPIDPGWALLDEYAMLISRHYSDLLWTEERGHRTPVFGELPEEPEPIEVGPNPFGADDPFAPPPVEGEAEPEATETPGE